MLFNNVSFQAIYIFILLYIHIYTKTAATYTTCGTKSYTIFAKLQLLLFHIHHNKYNIWVGMLEPMES